MPRFTHIGWPSFENIHRKLDLIEDLPVVVTEKIDGSNFGVEIWDSKIVGVNSRNFCLWNTDSDQPMPVAFMKNKLDFLTTDRDKLVALANALVTTDKSSVTIFGEIFKSQFYPFGYAIRHLSPGEHVEFFTMSHRFWHLVTSLGLTPPRLIFPDELMLTEAIEQLHSHMLTAPDEFEGVFITLARNCGKPQSRIEIEGFKYKTGLYEEQGHFNVKESKVPECFTKTVELLREVFATKRSRKPEPTVKKPAPVLKYEREIRLAFASVVSKTGNTAQDLRLPDREQIIKTLTQRVKEDLLSQFLSEKDTFPVPDEDVLNKELKKLVPKLLASTA